MKTRIIQCSVCGKDIERSMKTKVFTAKCRPCKNLAISETIRKNREQIGTGFWSTRSEIRFINNLRPEVAKRYLDGPQRLMDRTNWECIDRDQCIAACRKRAGV